MIGLEMANKTWQIYQRHPTTSAFQVDLAGSERLAKSGVSGDRQKEAQIIGELGHARKDGER